MFSSAAYRLKNLPRLIKNRFNPSHGPMDHFGIEPGMHVVELACGPGLAIQKASRLVGDEGLVSALDESPFAIEAVNERAFRKGLQNVMGRLIIENIFPLDDQSVDMLFRLWPLQPMENANAILSESHRVLSPEGHLFLHVAPPSTQSLGRLITDSGLFILDGVVGGCLRCRPRLF